MPIINPANITNLDNGRCDHLDVLSELYNSRVLMLNEQVTPAVCSQLIANMLVLERKDPEAPITLLVSSPGGDVYAGLGLIDVMRDLSCPVTRWDTAWLPAWPASSWPAAAVAAHIRIRTSCCTSS